MGITETLEVANTRALAVSALNRIVTTPTQRTAHPDDVSTSLTTHRSTLLEAMAEEFGVPFLGRIPLDAAISRACEAGTAANSSALNGARLGLQMRPGRSSELGGQGCPPP